MEDYRTIRLDIPDAEPLMAFGQEDDDLAAWLLEGFEGTDESLEIGASWTGEAPTVDETELGGGASAGA